MKLEWPSIVVTLLLLFGIPILAAIKSDFRRVKMIRSPGRIELRGLKSARLLDAALRALYVLLPIWALLILPIWMLVSLVWAVIGVQDGFLLHIPALVAVGLFVALELFFQKGPPRDVVFDRELDAVSYGGRHLCQVSSVVGLELGEGPGSDDNRSGFNLVYLDGETEKRVAVDAGGSRSDYAEIRDAVNGWVFTHQRAHA